MIFPAWLRDVQIQCAAPVRQQTLDQKFQMPFVPGVRHEVRTPDKAFEKRESQ